MNVKFLIDETTCCSGDFSLAPCLPDFPGCVACHVSSQAVSNSVYVLGVLAQFFDQDLAQNFTDLVA